MSTQIEKMNSLLKKSTSSTISSKNDSTLEKNFLPPSFSNDEESDIVSPSKIDLTNKDIVIPMDIQVLLSKLKNSGSDKEILEKMLKKEIAKKEKKVLNSSSIKKKKEGPICNASVTYTTKEKAKNACIDGEEVIKYKDEFYHRCTTKVSCDGLCTKHFKKSLEVSAISGESSSSDKKEIVLFMFEDILKDGEVASIDNSEIWERKKKQSGIKHGKKGVLTPEIDANLKLNISSIFDKQLKIFLNGLEDNKIKQTKKKNEKRSIGRPKKTDISLTLSLSHSSEIVSHSSEIVSHSSEILSDSSEIVSHSSEILSSLSKNENDSENSENELENYDNILNIPSNYIDNEEEEEEEEEKNVESEEEIEQVQVIPVYDKKGVEYYLNTSSFALYIEDAETGEGVEIGVLEELSDTAKNFDIAWNDKKYKIKKN